MDLITFYEIVDPGFPLWKCGNLSLYEGSDCPERTGMELRLPDSVLKGSLTG